MANVALIIDPDAVGGGPTTFKSIADLQANYTDKSTLSNWTVTCKDGADIGGTVELIDWVTDASNKLTFVMENPHVGVFDATKFHFKTTGSAPAAHGLRIATTQNYVEFHGLQFLWDATATSGTRRWINDLGNDNAHYDGIFRYEGGLTSSAVLIGLDIGNGDNKLKSNLIYAVAGELIDFGILDSSFNAKSHYIYDNTLINCDTGITCEDGGFGYGIGNVVQGAVTAGYAGNRWQAGSDNNISNLADSVTNMTITQGTVAFASGTDNYHLAANDTVAKGQGADLTGDANLPVTLDFEGSVRAAPFDCGADQYTVVAVTATAASIALAAQDATVDAPGPQHTNVTATSASIVFAAQDTTVTAAISHDVTATSAALSITAFDAKIKHSEPANAWRNNKWYKVPAHGPNWWAPADTQQVIAGSASLTITPQDATVHVNFDLHVVATAASLTLTPVNASVTTGGELNVVATAGAIVFTTFDAVVQAYVDTDVVATAASITLASQDTSVTTFVGTSVIADSASLVFAPFDATVTAGVSSVNVTADSAVLNFAAFDAAVGVGKEFLIEGSSILIIDQNYQSKTLYCSESDGYFTID